MSATVGPTMWNFESGELPHREQLYKSALRLTRSVQDAEDLLQETYLKAFKYYQRFSEGTNFKAWLFKIMKNTFINNYRRKKLAPAQVGLDNVQEGLSEGFSDRLGEGMADPETELMTDELDAEVGEALKSLPHDYKVVVVLSDIQGYAYKEIAEILAVPVGTVMSRLYRGRRMLERALLSYGVRYNYLHGAPEKLRDQSINPGELFRRTSGTGNRENTAA